VDLSDLDREKNWDMVWWVKGLGRKDIDWELDCARRYFTDGLQGVGEGVEDPIDPGRGYLGTFSSKEGVIGLGWFGEVKVVGG